MSELYDQEKDLDDNYKDNHTWADDHAVGESLVGWNKEGVYKFSKNMGHGPLCETCSAGVLEKHEQELSRDQHFKQAMNMHNPNLGGE